MMKLKKLQFTLIILCILVFQTVFSQTPEIEWQNTIGGKGSNFLHVVKQTFDGGYIIGGSSDAPISGDKTEKALNGYYDYWVIKLNNTGEIEFENTIG